MRPISLPFRQLSLFSDSPCLTCQSFKIGPLKQFFAPVLLHCQKRIKHIPANEYKLIQEINSITSILVVSSMGLSKGPTTQKNSAVENQRFVKGLTK